MTPWRYARATGSTVNVSASLNGSGSTEAIQRAANSTPNTATTWTRHQSEPWKVVSFNVELGSVGVVGSRAAWNLVGGRENSHVRKANVEANAVHCAQNVGRKSSSNQRSRR